MTPSSTRSSSEAPNKDSGETPFNQLRLVSALLTADWDRARQLLADSPIDQVDFMAWLRRHHLAGQFSALITDSPLHEGFPKSLVDKTGRFLVVQTAHNAKVRAATCKAVKILKSCGIRPILLKGIHYASRFHGGLDQRFLWDVDLLVRDTDREAAIACLTTNGYQSMAKGLWSNRFTRKLVHAVSLHDGEVEVDLHWHLRNRPAYRINYDALWQSCQAFYVGDDRFDVPSDAYCLLTLLLGLAHDLELGHFKLKHLFDLHCMLHVLDASMDWEQFFNAREHERLAGLSVNVLAFYLLLFDSGSALPRLTVAVDQRRGEVRVNEVAEACALVEGPRQNLRNRRWYASVYPGGALNYVLWWSVTAPFRYAVGRNI